MTRPKAVSYTHLDVYKRQDMSPLKGRPSKGTILDLDLKVLDWHAGILHFGHWLVHNGSFWRFGATYAWAWDAPGIPEAPAVQVNGY